MSGSLADRPPSSRADSHQGPHRNLQGALHRRIWVEASGEAGADRSYLGLGTSQDRVVEDAGDVERRLPELVEAGTVLGQLQRLNPDLVKAGVFQQGSYPFAIPERERPGRARCGWVKQTSLHQLDSG